MKFAIGETVALDGVQYQIERELGMGAVASIYLAHLLPTSDLKVALKVVRPDAVTDPQNLAALRRESQVLEELNIAEDSKWRHISSVVDRARYAERTKDERAIIALLGQGEIPPEQAGDSSLPFVVQAVAPPAFERFEIQSPADELKLLRVMKAVVEVIALTHHTGLALKDFEPETKGDRIRVQWDESQRGFCLKIIDWNVTGDTVAEQAQDLLYFGGHLYYFLLGRHLRFDNPDQPPVNISLGVPNWEDITEGSRQLLQKLLHRDPQRRYQSADALLQDMVWWIDTLEQIGASDALQRLDRRLWQARPAKQYGRVLATADLGLRLKPPVDARESFLESRQKAREELEKADWEPIARARMTLGTGAYEGAAREFAQQVRILDPESKTARIARIYLQLSRAGALLKQSLDKRDIRPTPEWDLVSRLASALVKEQWQDAQNAVLDLTRRLPSASSWPPINTLRDLAQAGVLAEQAMHLTQSARPRRADADRADWFRIEQEQIQEQHKAVEKLEQARELAPDEPVIHNALLSEVELLKQREQFLQRYKDADTFIKTAEKTKKEAQTAYNLEDYARAATLFDESRRAYQGAIQEFQEILSQDATQPRANIYRDRVQREEYNIEQLWQETTERAETQKRLRDATNFAQDALRLGQYDDALRHAQVAAQIAPDRPDIQMIVTESRTGERLLAQAQRMVQSAQTYSQMGNFQQAEDLLQDVLAWNAQPLAALSRESSLIGGTGDLPFRLLEKIAEQASDLLVKVRAAQKADQAADRAWERGDYKSVIVTYERDESHLTPTQKEKLAQARARVLAWEKATPLVREPRSFEDLKTAVGLVADDPSPKADDIREQAAEGWRQLVERLQNWTEAAACLRDGLQSFEHASIIETFETMLDLVERAQSLQDQLSVSQNEAWPNWLSGRGWKDQLLRVVDGLSYLAKSQNWRQLREQVDTWRNVLINEDQSYVAVYLREHYGPIYEKACGHKFEEALNAAEGYWDSLPDEVQKALPADVRNAYVTLMADLRGRLNANAALGRILQQVEEGGSFTDAYNQAKDIKLPDRKNIDVEDLQMQLSDLQKAAEMERLLGGSPTGITYALFMDMCRRLAMTKLATFTTTQALSERLENLQQNLTQRSEDTARTLLDALQEETKSQIARPERDPQRLLSLYRQARWWEAVTLRGSDEVAAVLSATKDILVKLANDLQQAESPTAFERVARQLQQLSSLNNGVTRTDESPPLPESVTYEAIAPLLGGELETLRDEVQEMRKLAARAAQGAQPEADMNEAIVESPVVSETMEAEHSTSPQDNESVNHEAARYDTEKVTNIRDLSQAVQTTLEHLQRVWSAFDILPNWETGQLMDIGSQAKLLENVVEGLAEAHRRLAQNAAMQGLDVLYRRLEQRDYLENLDKAQDMFWDIPRQALQANYRALRQDLIAALSHQISDIFDSSDAIEQLQQRILYVSREKSVAQAAFEAIREGVMQRAAMVEADLQRREARRLWELVMKATTPWQLQSKDMGRVHTEQEQQPAPTALSTARSSASNDGRVPAAREQQPASSALSTAHSSKGRVYKPRKREIPDHWKEE